MITQTIQVLLHIAIHNADHHESTKKNRNGYQQNDLLHPYMLLTDRTDNAFRLDDKFDLVLAGPAAIKSTRLLCLYQLQAQYHPSLSPPGKTRVPTNVFFIQN